MKCLVINLPSDTRRWKTFCKSNSGHGLEFTQVEGVDGRKLSNKWSYLSRWMHLTHEPAKFNIMPAIGCFLSHRKCWQHIVDEQLPRALVLEDDAIFTSLTAKFISAYHAMPEGIDWLRLHAHRHPSRKDHQRAVGRSIAGVPLTVNLAGSKSNAAYIITRSGAEKALSLTKLLAPVDHLEWFFLLRGLHHAQTSLNLVELDRSLPSSISGLAPSRLPRVPAIIRIGLIRSTLGWYANRKNWTDVRARIHDCRTETKIRRPLVPGQRS